MHGNLDVAQQKAEKARVYYSARDADWAMKFRILEAEILSYQGRRPEVIALLTSPGVLYPTVGDSAIKWNLLCALAHARLGQGLQADGELQQAQRLSAAGNSELIGEVLRTEAVVQLYRNHLQEAADLSRKSLQAASTKNDKFLEASDLLNLGLIALKLEHYDEAVALFDEAANAAKPIQALPIIQLALGNTGVAYEALGDFEKALSNFQQAEQAARSIGMSSTQVDWLWNAGSVYYRLGDLKAAANCYQESLKDATAISSFEEMAGIETDLAFLLYQQQQFAAAKMHSEQAIQASRNSGDQAGELGPMFLQALLASKQADGQSAEKLLLQINAQSAQSPSLQEQTENALANFYAEKKQARPADLWYRKSIRTFEDQRAAVRNVELRLPFFANGDKLYRDYADFLIASQKQQQALHLLDLGRTRTLSEALGTPEQSSRTRSEPAVDEQTVARNVNATILFYSLGVEKSYLWTVTARGTRLFVLPSQLEIEARVRAYQKAILRSSDPLRDANETAQVLYETLVAPAAAAIPKDSRIFIIPDGILNELNFETLLVSGERPHYWIEEVTLSTANSIHRLSRLDTGSSPVASKKLLLVGNPTTKGTGYETLLNAFAEIRDIEKHFSPEGTVLVTQSQAVPAAYAKSKPDDFAYIHFVAHGTASRLSPLDSAVILSPSPENPDDFKLYARDILRYPLHARLVTISACYGSGMRSYAGEGLVGLSWAFLRAGSHNVIGALWEVNDASTPLLMDRLYGELESGSSPDVALRAAKLSLIHSPGVYRKPLYWGGFELFTGS